LTNAPASVYSSRRLCEIDPRVRPFGPGATGIRRFVIEGRERISRCQNSDHPTAVVVTGSS